LLIIETILQVAYYALAGGEFLFRRTGLPIFASDPVRCYGVMPNLEYEHNTNEFRTDYYTNSLGFRTGADHRELIVPKPEDVYRILLMGPSFAFGWGVDYEEIFPTLLEEQLTAGDKRVEFMNMGTPAQGVAHQLCWVNRNARRFDPDLVLQVSYGTAIPNIATKCPEDLPCPFVSDGQLHGELPTFKRKAIAKIRDSAIVFYGYYVYQSLVPSSKQKDMGKELHAATDPPLDPSDYTELANRYVSYLDNMERVLGPDTPILFLFIPYSFVVHEEDLPRWSHYIQGADPLASRRKVKTQMAALEERGIPMINPLPELLTRAEHERLYFWLDIHFTSAGNRAIADFARAPIQAAITRQLRDADAARLPAVSNHP
jgi:hypothetical protein